MQMIRKYEETQKNWDEVLPLFLFACRDVPSESTGFSPFELLYGQQARGPLDILRNHWVPSSRSPKSATEWLQENRKLLENLRHNIAEINQMRAKQKAKDRHDKQATERSFSKVLVFFLLLQEN